MSEVTIRVRKNGPLLVEGGSALVDADGKAFGLGGRTSFALCRCGHSASKPFCDGSHARQGFESDCPARDLPPPSPRG